MLLCFKIRHKKKLNHQKQQWIVCGLACSLPHVVTFICDCLKWSWFLVHTVLMKLRLSCICKGHIGPNTKIPWQKLANTKIPSWKQNIDTVFMTGHTYLKLHLLRVMTFCIVSGAQKYMYINFWTFFATYSVINDEIWTPTNES